MRQTPQTMCDNIKTISTKYFFSFEKCSAQFNDLQLHFTVYAHSFIYHQQCSNFMAICLISRYHIRACTFKRNWLVNYLSWHNYMLRIYTNDIKIVIFYLRGKAVMYTVDKSTRNTEVSALRLQIRARNPDLSSQSISQMTCDLWWSCRMWKWYHPIDVWKVRQKGMGNGMCF